MYCENCFKEELDYWVELPDGTIVCSDKCEKEWKEVIKINRKKGEIDVGGMLRKM